MRYCATYCTLSLEHGEIEISNNQVENAIRPFVVGRKGWLFADTPQGAEASAIIYSLMETAKANSLRLDDYLAKKRREGKHYNVAISHAIKKLVRLIFALQRSGQAYCPAA